MTCSGCPTAASSDLAKKLTSRRKQLRKDAGSARGPTGDRGVAAKAVAGGHATALEQARAFGG